MEHIFVEFAFLPLRARNPVAEKKEEFGQSGKLLILIKTEP